jgi:leader peptidase (prepilin peptidase)/N-methyltransferase
VVILGLVIFIIGNIFGFLLNILVHVIPHKLSCFSYDNIKNAFINKAISVFIILITGIVFYISYLYIGFSSLLIKALILDTILILVFIIDLKHKIIPNKVVLVSILFSVISFYCDNLSIINMLSGALVGGGIFFLLALIPKAIGGGDVKFMFAMGVFLGLGKILMATYIGVILGAVISIFLLVSKLKKKKDHIPYGPFLTIGCFISFHFYDQILNYLV